MRNLSFLLIGFLFFSSCSSTKEETPTANKNSNLFDDELMHTISITFDQPNFWDTLVHHKKMNTEHVGVSYSLMGKVEIDSTIVDSVGIKIKGESSYAYYPGKKKSLKIDFNKFVKKQNYQKYKLINLNNSFKDPTFLREKFYLDALKEIGVPAQKNSYAKLFINGEYWGLYLVLEGIDKRFLKRNFKNNSGYFFKGEPRAFFNDLGEDLSKYRYDYILDSKHDKDESYADLKNLIQTFNNADSKSNNYKAEVEKNFNLQNCLKIWAVNTVLMNTDAYNTYFSHNFFLYKNESSKKYEWINYDGNYSFGAWSKEFTKEQLENFDLFYLRDPAKFILIQKFLIDNPQIRADYIVYVKQAAKFIEEKHLEKRIKKHSDFIRAAVYEDKHKMYTNEEFENNLESAIGDVKDPGAFVPGLKVFSENRLKSIKKQLNN